MSYSRPRSLPWASPLAVADGDGDHHRHFVLGDQIVQRGEQGPVGSVRPDDEGRGRAGDILFGDVDGNVASVGSGMAGGDDQFGGIGGICRAEGAGLARDAGIDLAVGRIHGEVEDRSLRHAFLRGHFRRGIVRGAEDEVSVGVWRRDGAVGQFFRRDIAGRVGIARGRDGARGARCRQRSLRRCLIQGGSQAQRER